MIHNLYHVNERTDMRNPKHLVKHYDKYGIYLTIIQHLSVILWT